MLKEVDDRDWSDEDDYETPPPLYRRLCTQYGIHPRLDVAARSHNTKCEIYLSDAMYQEWRLISEIVDIWCNPPHSMTEEFIRRADSQHKKYGMNIMMIIPANVISTIVYHELIENELKVKVENHPIKGRPIFLKNNQTALFPSRNAYQIIIWRQKTQI